MEISQEQQYRYLARMLRGARYFTLLRELRDEQGCSLAEAHVVLRALYAEMIQLATDRLRAENQMRFKWNASPAGAIHKVAPIQL